jgi:iron complex outermembrane recepter protein
LAEPALETSIGYGNYQTTTATLFGSAKLNPNIGASLSVNYKDQDKGWSYNSVRNERVQWDKNLSIQAKVAMQATDTTKLTMFYWYDHTRNSLAVRHVVNGYRSLDGVLRNLGYREFVAGDPDDVEWKSYLGYAKLEQDLGFANFVSITAARKSDILFHLDQDMTPLRVLKATQVMPTKNFSQEFQILSKPESKITWLVGAYFFTSKALYKPITLDGSAFNAFGGQLEEYRNQENKSVAGFGQVTVPIMENTNVTAGLRYTDETNKFVDARNTARGVPVAANLFDDKVDSSGWTGRLSLDHKFTPDIMGYASYNRGLKSGGFPLVTVNNLPGYRPEKLDAYEVGFKSQFFDDRARLNVAAFLYKFKDIQVTRTIIGGNAIANAARATIKGIDVDFEMNVSRAVNIYGAFTYLDSQYDDYPDAIWFYAQPNGSVRSVTQSAAGNRTIYSPKWNGTLGTTVTVPFATGSLRGNLFIQYTDKQYYAPDNFLPIGAYALVNGSLGWQTDDRKLGVTLWVRNLMDRHYRSNINQSSVGFGEQPGDPRTFGVTISSKIY